MRVLLDEVFGARNFVSMLAWEKVAGRDIRSVMSKTCDFVLVYSSSSLRFKNSRNLLPRDAVATASAYANPDGDTRGPWTSGDFTAQFNPAENPRDSQRYTLITPEGRSFDPPPGRCWLYTKDRYEELVADNRVWFGEEGNNIPRLKRFLSELQDGLVPKTLRTHAEVGHNDLGKKEIQTLFTGQQPFSTPKPERLLERIIHIGSNPGDIVLDVFAGSGTTAAVAQKMGRRWVTCELLESTFTMFTRPRLEKVVNNEDPGGITRTKGERVDATEEGLPDGVSPEDAAKFTSVLNKLIADDPEAKKDARVKALKAAAKTRRTKEVVNWRGGGGFQVAHLSPSCFDYDPALDRVMLTPEATGEVLVASVAANLGFSLLHPDDDMVFDGRRGNSLLKVVEGVAIIEEVDRLVEQIQPGETIVLAATVVLDGVREHLRRACKGSRVVAIPDDIFRYSQGGEL